MTHPPIKRGEYVQTWFDTGAFGYEILYGVVISAGPKTYRVRWESGLTNRVRQSDHHICNTASSVAEARAAMRREEATR